MAEEICGGDAGYGPDPMPPSDNECSSVEDDDKSNDDEIEEFYADPAAPARGRVCYVERLEVVTSNSASYSTSSG